MQWIDSIFHSNTYSSFCSDGCTCDARPRPSEYRTKPQNIVFNMKYENNRDYVWFSRNMRSVFGAVAFTGRWTPNTVHSRWTTIAILCELRKIIKILFAELEIMLRVWNDRHRLCFRYQINCFECFINQICVYGPMNQHKIGRER